MLDVVCTCTLCVVQCACVRVGVWCCVCARARGDTRRAQVLCNRDNADTQTILTIVSSILLTFANGVTDTATRGNVLTSGFAFAAAGTLNPKR